MGVLLVHTQDIQSVMLMLMLDSLLVLLLLTLVSAQSPHLLLFAVVFLSGIVTRFLSTDQGRLPRLFAKLLSTSRSSRTVPTLLAPHVHNNQSSNLIHLLLLVLTPVMDPTLLSLTMVLLLLELPLHQLELHPSEVTLAELLLVEEQSLELLLPLLVDILEELQEALLPQ